MNFYAFDRVVRTRTTFIPNPFGAHSTDLTLPFASVSNARSTHRSLLRVFNPMPFRPCSFESGRERSQTRTVRSKEDETMNWPCCGCAHESFDIAASCAWSVIHPQPKEPRNELGRTFHSSSTLHSPDCSSSLHILILQSNATRKTRSSSQGDV